MEIIDKKPFEQVTKDFDEIAKRYDFLSDIERSKTEFYYNESLLRATCLISKADTKGIITYVNDKFCEISGYTEEELIGQDHKILNSGAHNKKFWQKMYETCLKDRKIWQDTITNAKKNGELYHVQSWIQATFDHEDKFTGYISVRQDVTELINKQLELDKKNTYLEHAAKILRHDMHSGINTYIPRGISSLERRLSPKLIKELKLEIPFKMLKEGLKHTQKVYRGVYDFTNLVKKNIVLEKKKVNLKEVLKDYLTSTSYSNQVIISELPEIEVNESLFCTAIDNLIRNGLKYNDSATKIIKIYMEKDCMVIEDNGRGLSQKELDYLSKPYTRRRNQKETGSGLGLNICIQILLEHKFKVWCNKIKTGTKFYIQF